MKIIEFVYFNQSVVKSSYCPLWTQSILLDLGLLIMPAKLNFGPCHISKKHFLFCINSVSPIFHMELYYCEVDANVQEILPE